MKKDGQYSMDDYFLRQVDVRLCLREASPLYSSEAITSPESAVNVMASEMRSLDNEHLCVVNLNTALQPINFTVASIGGLNYTCAEARHVFKSAILSNAASIILIHLCEASHKWIYAKCFFMRSFSLDPADSLVFKGDIASHKTVTDSYVAIGSSPPSVYRNTASLTQELGCS